MTGPQKLINECDSDWQRAILGAGRFDSSAERKMRVLAALGVGTAVAVGSKTSLAMAALWKKAAVGGLLAAGGVTGVVAYRVVTAPSVEVQEFAQAEVSTAAGAYGADSKEVADEEPVEAEEPAALEAASPELPVVAPRTVAPGRSKAASPDRVAPAHDGVSSDRHAGLNEELSLLDAARSAVNGGRPGEALKRLDEHSSRFPKGSLRLEAEVLRVQALAGQGRKEEASRRAKRVLERSPNSVVAARLRRYVIE